MDNFLRKLSLVYGKDSICTIPNTDISVTVNTLACEITKMHLFRMEITPAYQGGTERYRKVQPPSESIVFNNSIGSNTELE